MSATSPNSTAPSNLYAQLFPDERALARRHHRGTVWLSLFIAFSVALFASGAAYFAATDLQHRLEAQSRCATLSYPYSMGPYSPPFANAEECVARTPLLTGEARDFGGFALAGYTVALTLTLFALLRRRSLPHALRVLRERPEAVRWAFIVQVNGMTEHTISLNLAEGVQLLDLRDRATAEEVLQRIARLCPNALLGYSEERARQFSS